MSAARILSTAAIAIGLITAGTLSAQDKGDKAKERAPVVKVLLENDKVRVTETTFQPGDVSRAERKARTNYIITDGKLERTAKDGKKTVYDRKAGTAVWMGPDSDVVRNVGKARYVVIGITNK